MLLLYFTCMIQSHRAYSFGLRRLFTQATVNKLAKSSHCHIYPPPRVNAQFHSFSEIVKRFSVRVNKYTRTKLFTRIISSTQLCQRELIRFPAAGWLVFPNVLPFCVSFLLHIICGELCCHECSFSHSHYCVCVRQVLVLDAFFCFPLSRALVQERCDPVFLRWREGRMDRTSIHTYKQTSKQASKCKCKQQ